MKRILRISALILVYFLSSARSCNDAGNEDAAFAEAKERAAKDSITSAFSSDSLSPATLRAFELTARYKLTDFADYLQIFTDRSTNPAFKNKAGKMIRDLFISEDVRLEIGSPGHQDKSALRLKDILGSELKNGQPEERMAFDSIRLKQTLHRENDTLFSGQLAFRILYSHAENQQKSLVTGSDNIAEIFLVKRKLIFGTDSLKVWKVFLGEIH